MRRIVVGTLMLHAVVAFGDGRMVRGVIIDRATGAPIDDASVVSGSRTVNTAQDGSFTLTIGSEDHELVITAPGYASKLCMCDLLRTRLRDASI